MSETTGARGYQIHEFARLTGLTVRALQHYDHLGLLKPVRSRAGHRTYSDHDFQALVQILALKSVGVPLRQIAALRRSGGPGLARALHMQRVVLERRRPLLEKAITAIQNVELALEKGEEADPATLRSLIEAVGPQEDLPPGLDDTSAPVAAPAAPRVPDRLEFRRRWQELLDDVVKVADTDPAGPQAQTVARRWVELLQELAGSGAGSMSSSSRVPACSVPPLGRIRTERRRNGRGNSWDGRSPRGVKLVPRLGRVGRPVEDLVHLLEQFGL